MGQKTKYCTKISHMAKLASFCYLGVENKIFHGQHKSLPILTDLKPINILALNLK